MSTIRVRILSHCIVQWFQRLHGIASHPDAVGVVHEPAENAVGQSGMFWAIFTTIAFALAAPAVLINRQSDTRQCATL